MTEKERCSLAVRIWDSLIKMLAVELTLQSCQVLDLLC